MPLLDPSGSVATALRARGELLSAVARGRFKPSPNVRPAPYEPPLPSNQTSGLNVEELEYQAEVDSGSQQWVPLRIVSPSVKDSSRFPAVVLLHATGNSLADMAGCQLSYARKGYLTAAIDCRYHGRRAGSGPDARSVYQAALVRAWRERVERPFLLDTVWDIQILLDYLESRPDVDARRIGMTGVSLGGMHTWLTAAADPRVAVAAPMIGVQHFGWAVDNDSWQARVSSIPDVFAAAAKDLGRNQPDAETVRAVWDAIMPGLLSSYDAPQSLPAIAPRPLLIANGELDPRCPIEGLDAALPFVQAVYAEHGVPNHLSLYIEKGLGHAASPGLEKEIEAFLDKHLQPK